MRIKKVIKCIKSFNRTYSTNFNFVKFLAREFGLSLSKQTNNHYFKSYKRVIVSFCLTFVSQFVCWSSDCCSSCTTASLGTSATLITPSSSLTSNASFSPGLVLGISISAISPTAKLSISSNSNSGVSRSDSSSNSKSDSSSNSSWLSMFSSWKSRSTASSSSEKSDKSSSLSEMSNSSVSLRHLRQPAPRLDASLLALLRRDTLYGRYGCYGRLIYSLTSSMFCS